MKRLLLSVLLLATVSLTQAQTVPVSTESDEARTHFDQGLHALANANFAKGREYLDAALEADPDFALAHMYRATASPAALRDTHMEMAVAHADDVSEGERMMIESYQASLNDDLEGEMAILAEVAERYPDDPWVPFIMGWNHYGEERYDDAKASAMRSLEADQGFAGAYNMLGYIALNQEDYDAAEAAFKNYVRLAPDEANPYDSLGELYLNMARYDEAAKQFEMALERDSDFSVSLNNLARAGIEQANMRFEQAFGQQDADAMAGLYTANGMLLPPESGPISGREAVRTFWAGLFDAGLDEVELTTREVTSMGDYAYEVGTSKIMAGGEVAGGGKYTVLWQKDGDTWRLHRDMWNAGPAPMTAEGDN